jgi:flagellar motor switch protein FliM
MVGAQACIFMAEALSQSDIEALLSQMAPSVEGASEPSISTTRHEVISTTSQVGALIYIPENQLFTSIPLRKTHSHGIGGQVAYEVFDFRRSDKFSKDQLRSLQVIHENFARVFKQTISAYLRQTVKVDLVSIDQVPYEEYIRSISGSLINILNVDPLSGQAMLDVELRFLFAMIDRLLGGPGESHYKPTKDLTDVEKVLARSIVTRALTDLEAAWHEAMPLEFSVASVETSSQFIQLVPNNETVLLLMFDMSIGEQRGSMCLSIPYMLLKPFAHNLGQQHWFSHRRKSSKSLAPKMAQRLREMTKVPCIARLGTSTTDVETLVTMEIGQILPLSVPMTIGEGSEPSGVLAQVELMVCDKPKFRGHIGLRGGKRLAVQIDDIIEPPPGLEVHRESPSDMKKEAAALA